MSAYPEIIRNTARADRNIAWIEKLKLVVDGEVMPFKLADFQQQFIRDVYEPEDVLRPGKKLVNRGILSVGRKNGKSELGGAIVLLHLIGPEAELNNQIISGATTREQARIVFEAACRFVSFSPSLQKHLKIVDSRSVIYVKTTGIASSGSKYKAISAKPGAAHGLSPSVILMDELAQATNRKFFDALISSQGARSDPFLMVISTVNEDPGHVLSTLIEDAQRLDDYKRPVNPRVVAHVHAAKDGCDIMDEAEWYRSNPGLGLWIDLERFRADAEEAARSAPEEAQFRLYRLNQMVAADAPLVSREAWFACAPSPFPAPAIHKQGLMDFEAGETLFGGLDFSVRVDLTALAMVSAERCFAKVWFYKPADDLKDAEVRDGQRYRMFADQGWLIPSPDASIDPALVVSTIADLHKRCDIAGLAYDRFKIAEFLRDLEKSDIAAQQGPGSGLSLVPWGQSYVGMTPAVTALEAQILNHKLTHDGNPLLTWCMANAKVKNDPSVPGNRKLVKLTPRLRIDGAVALAMALGLRAQSEVEKPYSSPFEDPSYVMPVF